MIWPMAKKWDIDNQAGGDDMSRRLMASVVNTSLRNHMAKATVNNKKEFGDPGTNPGQKHTKLLHSPRRNMSAAHPPDAGAGGESRSEAKLDGAATAAAAAFATARPGPMRRSGHAGDPGCPFKTAASSRCYSTKIDSSSSGGDIKGPCRGLCARRRPLSVMTLALVALCGSVVYLVLDIVDSMLVQDQMVDSNNEALKERYLGAIARRRHKSSQHRKKLAARKERGSAALHDGGKDIIDVMPVQDQVVGSNKQKSQNWTLGAIINGRRARNKRVRHRESHHQKQVIVRREKKWNHRLGKMAKRQARQHKREAVRYERQHKRDGRRKKRAGSAARSMAAFQHDVQDQSLYSQELDYLSHQDHQHIVHEQSGQHYQQIFNSQDYPQEYDSGDPSLH